jgi:zinc transport system ATP-binding protein
MTQIDFSHVSFSYDGEPVLHDATFGVGEREIVCIVGPNGSGKTTLLRLILGLVKPRQGTVSVFGEPPQRVRHLVGYVPQQTLYDPEFPVNVLDVVLMGRLGRTLTGAYSAQDRAAAHQALAEVGLADMVSRPFAALSGGQRQRVLIARGLVCSPRLLLLDEPTSNVDQSTTQKLYQVLKDLSTRMTVVFVSHDVGIVTSIVTSVLCVNQTVSIHPTSSLTGERLATLYEGAMALVRHDHRCAESGHTHE